MSIRHDLPEGPCHSTLPLPVRSNQPAGQLQACCCVEPTFGLHRLHWLWNPTIRTRMPFEFAQGQSYPRGSDRGWLGCSAARSCSSSGHCKHNIPERAQATGNPLAHVGSHTSCSAMPCADAVLVGTALQHVEGVAIGGSRVPFASFTLMYFFLPEVLRASIFYGAAPVPAAEFLLCDERCMDVGSPELCGWSQRFALLSS